MHVVGPRGGTIYTKYTPRTYMFGYCMNFWVLSKVWKYLENSKTNQNVFENLAVNLLYETVI